MSSIDQWMKSGRYLPPFLRDFHDQKDAFKAMHHVIDVEKHEYAKDVSWVVGQCYVIDIFLWFMAKRGYTLQRSRQRLPFRDMDNDISAEREAATRAFAAMLDETRAEHARDVVGGVKDGR